MSRPSALRRVTLRALAVLMVAAGLVILAFPFLMLASFDPGPHLLDDTRAAWGAGRTTGLTVSRHYCSRMEFGSEGSRGRGISSIEFDCTFVLDEPDAIEPVVEPDWAAMTYEEREAFRSAEDERYHQRLLELERGPGPNDPPSELHRRLPDSAAGRPAPVVRQFTPDGVPPRYGLVWPDGGLGWRWFRWSWETLVFWAFAAGCFAATRALWRRASGSSPD
jgi:hypothetical protein